MQQFAECDSHCMFNVAQGNQSGSRLPQQTVHLLPTKQTNKQTNMSPPPGGHSSKNQDWETIRERRQRPAASLGGGAGDAAESRGGRRSLLTAPFKKLCCNFFSFRGTTSQPPLDSHFSNSSLTLTPPTLSILSTPSTPPTPPASGLPFHWPSSSIRLSDSPALEVGGA